MLSRLCTVTLVLLVCVAVVLSGCDLVSSSGSEEPTPTPIPPPPLPEKPTYVVKRGEIVDSLSFTGRVAPVIEEELFFRTNGRVKKVHVERDDMVTVGLLLAELENDDLLRQLAQTEIELEAAELNLKEAMVTRQYTIDRASINLEIKKLQLAKMEESLLSLGLDLEIAGANLEKAREGPLEKATIDLEIKKLQLAKMEESVVSLGHDLEIARLNLEDSKKGPTIEDLEIARHRVEQARDSRWGAQVTRDSRCGAAKDASCDSAQASVQRAEGDVRIAELNLIKAQQGPDPSDIAIEELKYEQAAQKKKQSEIDIEIQKDQIVLSQLELDRLKGEGDIAILEAKYEQVAQQKKQSEIDMEIQKSQISLSQLELENLKGEGEPQLSKALERSKLAVERLNAQVVDTRISSPIEGKVTSISAYEGREVNAYRSVFIVADEAELEITAEPMSSQLQRLAEDMSAAIILSAYPGKELPGQILQLPYPYGRGGGANLEEADKLTHISFDPEDLDIGPGDLVKVLITLERKADALWLPPAAIRTFAGRKFVEVDEDGRRRRVDIRIGIESAERTEILEGLEEGLVVVGA